MTDRPQLDLANYLPYLVNRLGGALVANMTANALAPFDLTIDMWRLLAVLSYRGAQRQVDLVDMTSIEASTVSRLVTRLARMGLVTRKRSETSNREVVIELTRQGARAGRAHHSRSRTSSSRWPRPACRRRTWRWSSARCGGCMRISRGSRAKARPLCRASHDRIPG